MYSIGVDIGGTKCKVGVVNTDNIISKSIIDTPNDGIESVICEVAKVIDSLVTNEEISGIGVGIRGTFNDGLLNDAVLKANDISIEKLFAKYFPGYKVVVTNDANAAAVAELKYGQLKGIKNGMLITLGTGIGAGIILDGNLYEGTNKNAGEIGRMFFNMNEIENYDFLNVKGTYESEASTLALVNRVKEALKEDKYKNSDILNQCENVLDELNAKHIFNAYDNGDELARVMLEKHFEYITAGIINLITIFDLEKIVISGGISKRGDLIINKIKEIIETNNLTFAKKCSIVVSKFHNDAGIIGSANLIL